MANHRDCRNYAPVDVTKGICHRTKELVPADAPQCAEFLLMPKCGNCSKFLPSSTPELGACAASTQDPKFFAYPDMVAVTCGHYGAN
jgi:4-hydroxyphenylacetate decarboxylase small subunit